MGHVDGNLPNGPLPAYNPADYAPPNDYGPPPPGGYAHDGDMNPGNPYARQDQNHYYQARRGDENVSAAVPKNSGTEHVPPASTRGGFRPTHAADNHTDRAPGVKPARDASPTLAPSPVSSREKGVKFDLNPQEQEISPLPSPDESPHPHRHTSSHESPDSDHTSRRRHPDDPSSDHAEPRDRKRHRRAESPGSDTDETIELPPRFDELGRRRGDDPAADRLESVLQALFR